MMPLPSQNAFIDSLPPLDRAALLKIATPFEFRLGDVFCEAGDRAGRCVFVDDGIISAVAATSDGRTIETFMVGPEGMTFPMAIEAGAAPTHVWWRSRTAWRSASRSPICVNLPITARP